MKILNLLTSGGLGGIEILNYDFGKYSGNTQAFAFLFGTGPTYERMRQANYLVYDLSEYVPKITRERFDKIKKIASAYDIVAVHHGDPYLKLIFIYLVKFCHIKGVTFVHSCWDDNLFFPNNKIKYYFGKKLFQKAMNISNAVIFVSQAGKNSYIKNFSLRNNVAIVYNGIGKDKIDDGINHRLIKHKPTELVYVGRLEKTKGIDILIIALSELNDTLDFHLTVVGDGSQRKALESKAKLLNLDKEVEFIGGKSDVKPYLKNAEIFVYPSICQEVFGISIVEAMAYGLICIANNVGGIPEVIKDGYNGYLNKSNDVDGLKESIKKSYELINCGNVLEMEKRAKETAAEFSIINTCRHLDKIYEGISD